MKKQKLNGHQVTMYDSIDELPITRFHAFNKMLLLDSGVGGDVEAVKTHITSIYSHVKREDWKALVAELENYHQNLVFVVQNLSPRYLAFAALVATVDGEAVNDMSTAGLREVCAMLGDPTVREAGDLAAEFKKKSDAEFEYFFQSVVDSAQMKEYHILILERTALVLRKVRGEQGLDEQIEKVEALMWEAAPPQSYIGKKGAEVEYIKRFESMCAVMSQQLNRNPKEMTTMEFYSAYVMLKKQEPKK